MSVRSEGRQVILEGRCRIEDAQTLLRVLGQSPDCIVDIRKAETLHTAIVQILLAAGRPVRGIAGDGFLARYGVLSHLGETRAGGGL
jgi:hypothetical protein